MARSHYWGGISVVVLCEDKKQCKTLTDASPHFKQTARSLSGGSLTRGAFPLKIKSRLTIEPK
ncbi:hypothetical protein BKP37_10160 [Anaerobacillus alkalilacustris]|uniref:Uncharacterized protein n=1 Tax=Anaerobacillus alkalilacustris TaxID=393763 RepID=A0A1S2LM99_9BACI|nr:hypothetical protein BKP37_10160 [Anaerobacillus alkalilacustris]